MTLRLKNPHKARKDVERATNRNAAVQRARAEEQGRADQKAGRAFSYTTKTGVKVRGAANTNVRNVNQTQTAGAGAPVQTGVPTNTFQPVQDASMGAVTGLPQQGFNNSATQNALNSINNPTMPNVSLNPQSLEMQGFKQNMVGLYTKDGKTYSLQNGSLLEVQTGIAPAAGIKGATNIKAVKSLNQLLQEYTKTSKIGTTGLNPKAVGVGKYFAENTKNLKTVMKWVGGIAATLGVSMGAVSLYKDVVGTRVFTGFLGEETGQAAGYGFNLAYANGDVQGMQDSLTKMREVAQIMLSGEYKNGLPYDDALKAADGFAESLLINADIFERAMQSKLNNESNSEMWARINEERAQSEQATTDYYNEQRIITENSILELRKSYQEARDEVERNNLLEQIRLWEEYSRNSAARERADREEEARFWLEYHRSMQKLQDNSAPSKLNFGI